MRAQDRVQQSVEEARKEEEEFRSLIPRTGFLAKYMSYTDKQESPGSYHFWVGTTILSAALQRRVYVSKGIYKVHSNMFTILVGPSGKCRKSRALNLGFDLLSEFDWANIIADKTTPEALLQALYVGTAAMEKETGPMGVTINPNPDNVGIIPAGELAVFINRQTYTAGMVTLLTTLYDSPDTFRYLTRNKKPIILRNISLCMLGASTPEWLATNLPEGAFEGGFMSRIIFVVKNMRDRMIAFPSDPEPDETKQLKESLSRIRARVKGEMGLEPDARTWFEKWYTSVESLPVAETSLLGFVERKPDTILKVAMALAASEERRVITTNDLRQAHQIVTWTQEKMFQAFKSVDLSPLGVIQNKIIELLESVGGRITRGEVLRKLGGRLHRGVADLEDIEKVMEEAGLVRVIRKPTAKDGKGGRPSIIYQLTKVADDGKD